MTNISSIRKNKHSDEDKGRGVFTWGKGNTGQLGHRTLDDNLEVRLVDRFFSRKILKIAAGELHTIVLTDDGKVWGWGSSIYSQIGHTNPINTVPSLVFNRKGPKMVDASCGDLHSLFLSDQGRVYVCSSKFQSQRGPVETLTKIKFHSVHAGFALSCALSRNKQDLYIWGDFENVASLQNTWMSSSSSDWKLSTTEIIEKGLIKLSLINKNDQDKKTTISQVSVGDGFVGFVTDHGQIGTCGWRSEGTIPNESYFKSITCSSKLVYATTASGKVFTCVNNGTWSQLMETANLSVSKIVCSANNFYGALTSDGSLYTWGYGYEGQLGIGTRGREKTPVLVPGILFYDVAVGGQHMVATQRVSTSKYLSDMRRALESPNFKDITLIPLLPEDSTKNRVMVHKAVIKARMPKFFAIYKDHTEVEMKMTAKALSTLVKWMYCNKTSNVGCSSEDIACLTEFGEMYGIVSLLDRIRGHHALSGFVGITDFSSLINDYYLSDITFKIEDSLIYAHKLFLCNRCETFATMLEGKFAETQKDVIEISDTSKETFMSVLHFIYTDTIEHIPDNNYCGITPENVMEVFYAANYYGLSYLQQQCEDFLEAGLDFENVVDIFVAANQLNAQHLKASCIYVLKGHLELFPDLPSNIIDEINNFQVRKENK